MYKPFVGRRVAAWSGWVTNHQMQPPRLWMAQYLSEIPGQRHFGGRQFGGSDANANDVSADGSVIVGYCDSTAGNQAMRWTAAGGMVGSGDLPGAYESNAFNVSIDGSVVAGVNYFDVPNPSIQAFRWT